MEKHMDLSKKTTILFSPELHARLTRLAALKRTSMGELVRAACEREYGTPTREERREAVRQMAAMRLPVGDVAQMKRESVPTPEELMP